MAKTVAITIDVERLYKDAEKGVYDFLPLLRAYGVKSTFFCTCDVLLNSSNIIQAIISEGHEIASHGFRHPGYIDNYKFPYLNEMSCEQARDEIGKSKELFEANGINVRGFRAPALRISLQVLQEISRYFDYDSSVINLPLPSKKYNHLSRTPFFINGMAILPISNLPVLGIPIASPYFLKLGAEKAIRLLKLFGSPSPTIIYFHSFDLIKLGSNYLPTSVLKKMWYFKKCGVDNISFFREIFSFFKEQNVKFRTCSEILEEIRSS